MRIELTKGVRDDRIVVARNDGTLVESTFPKKGPVPHDATHWFVERELGMSRGFWGMVAGGHHPEEIAEIAKAAGHASAKRAIIPDPSIIELLQAERLVECFEADLWSGGTGDIADFIALGKTACSYSHVPLPVRMDALAIGQIRAGLSRFAKDWTIASIGHRAVLEWE